MSNQSTGSITAPAAGVVVGIVVFVLTNFTLGRPLIPSVESATNPSFDLSPVLREGDEAAAEAVVPAGGAYATVCQACHQENGEGMPGAFPPLAGSEWITGDPETPIRIVLLGLSGEIEVKGTKFNAMMPPPAGITDEQIVEAINHARTSWGNQASEIDLALVKSVRDSLAGRTNAWSADELNTLRSAAGDAVADAGASADGAVAEEAEAAEAAPAAEGSAAEAPAAAAPAAAAAEAPQEAAAP
ncbi:MAG: cytochrome c [Myxococcales bacterium]|nr:cytochrome c [Myxococcales bacterium]